MGACDLRARWASLQAIISLLSHPISIDSRNCAERCCGKAPSVSASKQNDLDGLSRAARESITFSSALRHPICAGRVRTMGVGQNHCGDVHGNLRPVQAKTVGFLQRCGLIFPRPHCRADFLLPCYETTTGGVVMSISTFMVLLLLTFGQILALSIGFLVLWLAGEFEDTGAPRQQLTAGGGSARVRRFIRASASVFALRWRRHVPAYPSSWMRAHRSLIAACVLLIAA